MKILPLTQNKSAIIDDADYAKVIQHKWHYNKADKIRGYARAQIGRKKVRLHNFLMGATSHQLYVDHINGNTLDNRRKNLRLCSPAQSARNIGARKNISGFKGVRWDKSRNKWQSVIQFEFKTYYLGRFADKIEAARIYNMKAKELFGDFAKLNHI